MSYAANITVTFFGTLNKAVGQITASAPVRDSLLYQLVDGAGAYAAQKQYNASGTIAESGSAAFDLVGGGLTDAFGDAVSWTKLKALLVYNSHATQPLTIVSTIAGLFPSAHTVAAGGCALVVSPTAGGYTVSAGVDTITLANGSGSSTTYTLAIAGV